MAMKEATMKDSDAAPSNDNNPEHSLERRFLYQNPSTGGTSSTSLTVRQLCRMFCPPSSSTSRFTAESQLLGLLDNGEYDEEWKPAKNIPVLRHAASSAFYYTTPQQGQQGPVSCRQLAHAIRDGMDKVQVYGVTTGNQWTLLTALPDLVVAFEAFQEGAKPPQQPTQALNSNAAAQEYDVSVMVYEDNSSINDHKPEALQEEEEEDKTKESEIQNELEAFLNSTDKMGPKSNGGENTQQQDDNNNEEETYESDGGTKYVKDPRTGNWIHEDLLPQQQQQPPRKKAKTQHSTIGNNNSNTSTTTVNKDNNKNNNNTKKKSKKSKFAAKNAKCWIYITGLPPDTTEDELAKFCSKVGIIDLDPATQRPKIKLYRDSQHQCKGDASLCYARPESVELALQVLDEAPFRLTLSSNIIRVERAKFQQRGDHHTTKKKVSDAQRKVAKLATQQAVDWDEGEINGRLTGGRKGLHIIVLRNLFHASDLKDDNDDNDKNQKLELLERKVRSTCEQEFGTVEKITVFARKGVVVVKFAQPGAASDAVKAWHGRVFELFGNDNNNNHTVQASFWDGVEDFTIRNEAAEQADMERRHDAFGDWIESQEELPPELRLKTET
ncbi:HIV Tat-specific factor 1 homolog [Seminavis robusta]|uniref:HIV Tat-specific factor 1 homolog n=1 Tax=Seminavis robusta TaxID=568900 RepID=A0A9N8EEI7_9STRA|nr:HIV Tat-specific factor 1 homolog [Seminavis robusta]|eukprot:Sro1009_g230700.1 HIV Tat-specific factor 1 homolog (610) ;mRNA; f:13768-15597